VECCKGFKSEYEKVSCCTEKGKSIFEFHFKKLAKNYHNFLASYFVVEGGVLTNEFRFINARR
jgi:hypothetical protein